MPNYLTNDSEEITKRILEIRKLENLYRLKLCAIRNGIPSILCWCYQAAEDGTTLPCPTNQEEDKPC